MSTANGGFGSGSWGQTSWSGSVFEREIFESGGWGLSTWGAGGWGISSGNQVSASDEVSATLTFTAVNIAETANMTDSPTTVYTVFGQVEEGAAGSETMLGGSDFQGIIEETANASTEMASEYRIGVRVVESAVASEQVTTLTTVDVSLAESATITDALTGRPLWENIDTGTEGTWTNIPTQ
jgi:hypothetical protein